MQQGLDVGAASTREHAQQHVHRRALLLLLLLLLQLESAGLLDILHLHLHLNLPRLGYVVMVLVLVQRRRAVERARRRPVERRVRWEVHRRRRGLQSRERERIAASLENFTSPPGRRARERGHVFAHEDEVFPTPSPHPGLRFSLNLILTPRLESNPHAFLVIS